MGLSEAFIPMTSIGPSGEKDIRVCSVAQACMHMEPMALTNALMFKALLCKDWQAWCKQEFNITSFYVIKFQDSSFVDTYPHELRMLLFSQHVISGCVRTGGRTCNDASLICLSVGI